MAAADYIDHSRTKAQHPQTGIREFFHRTFREEFYATSHEALHNLEELLADVDEWLDEYNRTRLHSSKRVSTLSTAM